jgi:hypothetical protein
MSEIAELYECRKPKARMHHRCCECDGVIQPGETYHRHFGIWEGDAMVFKTCNDCETLRSKVNATCDPFDLCPFEGLYEWVCETNEASWLAWFIATKRKRGAEVSRLLLDRESEHAA